jgi:hypothetical protein
MTDVTQKEIEQLSCKVTKLQKKVSASGSTSAEVAALQTSKQNADQFVTTLPTAGVANTTYVLPNGSMNAYVGGVWQSVGGATVSPATVAPLPNNNGTTPAGAVGTSVLYAREDHVHPRPVRLTPPATPVMVADGPGFVITSQSALKVTTTSEQVIYDLILSVTQTASAGWNTLATPNIAGFQTPNIIVQGTERAASGTLTQIMGHECAKWADNKVYMNVSTRTEPYAYNVYLQLTYNLN